MLPIEGGNKGLEGTEVDLFTIILTLLFMLLVILFIKKYPNDCMLDKMFKSYNH